MSKEEFLASGLLEQYVLKITTPEEEAIVEDFIRQYPDIRAQVKDLQQAMEAYAMEHAIPPPDGLKGRIMSDIQSPVTSGRLNLLNGILIAAALLLGTAAFVLFKNQNNLKQENQQLQSAYQELETNCLERQENQDKLFAQMQLLRNPETKHVHIRGTANSPEALVVVFWNEEEQSGLLQVENLPTPPSGKTYQIWADVEGEMIDAGLFNGETFDLQSIKYIANAETLNITLEPEGGSKHPTVELLQANGII